MSEGDLDLVRRAFAAWGPSIFDEGCLAEDHEFRPTVTGSDLVERPLFVGREGFGAYWQELERAWSSLAPELDALHDLGDGIVLSEHRLVAVGRASGVPVTRPTAGLHVIRAGRIAITHAYSTLEEARAMAGELRLATARDLFDAFNRGDADAFVALCDPEVEWHPLRSDIEGPYHGHEGIRVWFRESVDAFEELTIEVPDLRESGDRVLALGRLVARGRGGGVRVDSDVGMVLEGRGLRLRRGRAYPSHAAALQAARG